MCQFRYNILMCQFIKRAPVLKVFPRTGALFMYLYTDVPRIKPKLLNAL